MTKIRKFIDYPKQYAKKLFKKFKSLTLKKKIIVVFLILISLFILSNFLNSSKGSQYITAKAQLGSVTETVSETGTITTNGKTEIFSPTNGVVDEVLVENGELVIKGQELLKITSSATEQESQLAYSNYLAAKAALDAANSSAFSLRSKMYTYWDTYYDLSTGDNYENADGTPKQKEREAAEFQTAQDNWKAAEKQYKDQQTAISQAQASVNSTWLLYQATQNSIVKASIDGIISNLSVTSGKSVSIKSTLNLQPVLIITNESTTEIEVSFTEADITKVKVGQSVVIDVNAVDDKTYQGEVVRVDSIGTDRQGVIRYNVYIQITNPDSSLRPGMSADAEITTNTVDNVITVPNSSVKPYQGGKAVRIVDPKTKQLKYIPVTIGIKGKEKTEIKKGIDKDQEIVTALSNQQIKRPGLFGN